MECNHSIMSHGHGWEKAVSRSSSSSNSKGNGSLSSDLNRKLPPSVQRDDLPPTYVHVPTNHFTSGDDVAQIFIQSDLGAVLQSQKNAQAASCSDSNEWRRTSSVQNFISHTMQNASDGREGESSVEIYPRNLIHPHLFMNETRLDKKEQFEERLRRAHLRIQNSDSGDGLHPDTNTFTVAALNAIESTSSDKRYRSKSTPSRSAGSRMLPLQSFQRQSDNDNSLISGNCETSPIFTMQRLSHINHYNETKEETANILLCPHESNLLFDAPLDALSSKSNGDGDAVINSQVGTTSGPLDITVNFSSKSYAGSDHDILQEEGGQHTILEPPPPLPPATEKERLVERERQARLESERARRRHLALQRDRLQEEDDDVEEDVTSDYVNLNGSANGGLLGQVSFDVGLQIPAPEFEGDNALILGMDNESRSSVGSSKNILVPPLPPPATEKERLVERERQARLETERARRRQALLRERHQETDGDEVEYSAVGSDFDRVSFEGHGIAPSQIHERNGDVRLRPLDPIQSKNDVEANNLSFPMERFLEKSNNGESSSVPIDMDIDTSLPYTMELFLAEHSTREHFTESGVNETSDIRISGSIEQINTAPTDQETLIYDDDDDIPTNRISGLSPIPLNARGDSANLWISQASTSSTSTSAVYPRSQDLNDTDPIPRLTEAEIAQFSEVEHASLGNAPPQSLRDEPSEPSVVGRGIFLDHAFSVATQTTVIESVTEASVCPLESAFSDINESGESVKVIRLGSIISESMASSASVEAMPSEASIDSGHAHSIGMNGAISHSVAPSSHSTFDDIERFRFPAADVVSQAEIDCASIDNTPPHSIRDDHLSESSITVGLQPINIVFDEHIVVGVRPMADDSNDRDTLSNENDTASVEVMPSSHSDHRIETPLSEVNDRMTDIHPETIIYQSSDLCSRTSIEALPSIDLEDEGVIHEYATLNDEFQTSRGENFNVTIEATPLLPLRSDRQSLTTSHTCSLSSDDPSSPRWKSVLAVLTPSLVLIIAELPTFVIIAWGNDQLCSLLGVQQFQSVLASLVMTSFLNHHYDGDEVRNGTQQNLDRTIIFKELHRDITIGIFNGFFIGLIGYLRHFDLRLGVVLSFSVCAAIVTSKLCKIFVILLRLKRDDCRHNGLIQPGMAGLLDFICCLVILNLVCALYRDGQ